MKKHPAKDAFFMKEASPNLFERRLIHEKRSTILIVDFSFKALNQGSIRRRRIIPHWLLRQIYLSED
jgi:hypothetical protein